MKKLDPLFDDKDVVTSNTPVGLTLLLKEQVKIKSMRFNITERAILLASILEGFDKIKSVDDALDIINKHIKTLKQTKDF